jgi:hypothetical protein
VRQKKYLCKLEPGDVLKTMYGPTLVIAVGLRADAESYDVTILQADGVSTLRGLHAFSRVERHVDSNPCAQAVE